MVVRKLAAAGAEMRVCGAIARPERGVSVVVMRFDYDVERMVEELSRPVESWESYCSFKLGHFSFSMSRYQRP